MEDRHHLKSSRTTHSVVHDAPREKHDHHHKRAILFVGVTMTMVVVLALYAASFRYRELVPRRSEDMKRWGVVQEDFTSESASLFEGFREITGTVTGVLNARKARAKSIDIMKEKLVASASATDVVESTSSTPPTEDDTENVLTEN